MSAPRSELIETSYDIFISLSLATNDQASHNEYKLHISLSEASYTDRALVTLLNILKGALKERTISMCKFVDINIFKTELAAFRALRDDVKNHITQHPGDGINGTNNSDLFNRLITSLEKNNNSYHRVEFLVNQLPALLTSIEGRIASLERFCNNSQITIYLPEAVNHEKLFSLTEEINSALKRANAIRGEFADVQSPVNNYVSLRKEFLSKDIHQSNRINTHEVNKNKSARRAIALEQANSSLYQYLRAPVAIAEQLATLENEVDKLPADSKATANQFYKELHNAYVKHLNKEISTEEFASTVQDTINAARNNELAQYSTIKKILINIALCVAALCVGGVGLIAFLGYRAYQNKQELSKYPNNISNFWYVPRSNVIKAAEPLRDTVQWQLPAKQ